VNPAACFSRSRDSLTLVQELPAQSTEGSDLGIEDVAGPALSADRSCRPAWRPDLLAQAPDLDFDRRLPRRATRVSFPLRGHIKRRAKRHAMTKESTGDKDEGNEDSALLRESVDGTFVVKTGGEIRRLRVSVPRGPVAFRALLPAVRVLVDGSVALASQSAERQGAPISCKPGCCACCYYSPMLSPAEARTIAALVEALAEPRRSEVISRFEQAMNRLRSTGLLQRYEQTRRVASDGSSRAGYAGWHDDYLRLEIACPFLDDKRCSIYAERPMVCRNYLVRNDPTECGRIGGVLDRVSVQPSVARAAWVLGQEDAVRRSIMLVAALEWAATTLESGQRATGIQWLTRLKASLDAPEGAR
jgi:Fe-S-cluster containining protein